MIALHEFFTKAYTYFENLCSLETAALLGVVICAAGALLTSRHFALNSED